MAGRWCFRCASEAGVQPLAGVHLSLTRNCVRFTAAVNVAGALAHSRRAPPPVACTPLLQLHGQLGAGAVHRAGPHLGGHRAAGKACFACCAAAAAALACGELHCGCRQRRAPRCMQAAGASQVQDTEGTTPPPTPPCSGSRPSTCTADMVASIPLAAACQPALLLAFLPAVDPILQPVPRPLRAVPGTHTWLPTCIAGSGRCRSGMAPDAQQHRQRHRPAACCPTLPPIVPPPPSLPPSLPDLVQYAFLADRTGGTGLTWAKLGDPGCAS